MVTLDNTQPIINYPIYHQLGINYPMPTVIDYTPKRNYWDEVIGPTSAQWDWKDYLPQIIKEDLKQEEMKKLFQYSVIMHQYVDKDGKKEYSDSILVIEPKFILAKSEKDVIFKVTREIPEEFAGDPDNVEILVRAF